MVLSVGILNEVSRNRTGDLRDKISGTNWLESLLIHYTQTSETTSQILLVMPLLVGI